MDKLHQQVRHAQRYLNLQRFIGLLAPCLFVALFIAAVAVAIHKWYPTGIDPWIWNASWLGGAIVLGAVAALVWTYVTRNAALEAAIEIDRRFGLKERVSSSLALNDDERGTEAGQAVMNDAMRRVSRLEVSDRFNLSVGRSMLLPVLPAVIAFLVAFAITERGIDKPAIAKTDVEQKKQIKKSSEALRKKIEQRRKEMSEKGLKDAEDVLKEINQGLNDMDKKTDGDRNKAMIKLNNLADKLEQRRKKLGGADELRRQLNKLKDLNQGPADKLARAMKDGNFKDAVDALDKLKQQLKDGTLNEKDKQKLADQLDNMKNKLQEIANAHKQAMDDLQQQIKDAQDRGDAAEASNLQEALDKLAQKMPQMDQMQRMANKLGKASQAAKQGNAQQAQDALSQLASDLEQMQSDLDEMEALETTLDDLQMAKDAMKCGDCGGAGCKACQGGEKPGQGQGGGGKGKNGDGLGAAKGGRGARPENKNKTSSYDSRVKGKVGRGKAVIAGLADGPNAKGQVRDAIKSEFESQASGPADPLTGQRLPKSHQRHVEEYFESLREGSE